MAESLAAVQQSAKFWVTAMPQIGMAVANTTPLEICKAPGAVLEWRRLLATPMLAEISPAAAVAQ